MMMIKKLRENYFNLSLTVNSLIENNHVAVFLLVGTLVLVSTTTNADAQGFDGKKYGELCKRVLETVEGKFGALLTAAAGLGALVASAAGGFRMAWSLVVVAVGSFTLRTYQEIWFSPCGG